MYRFECPDIGEGVVEAEVLEWRVREGDWVDEDQILVDLLTDKAEIEIPSPRAGRIHRIHFQVGEVAPVGAVLIEIDDEAKEEGEAKDEEEVAHPAEAQEPVGGWRAAAPATETARSEESEAAQPPAMPERPRSRQKATEPSGPGPALDAVPAVRGLARRLGVDLTRVRGTGPGGRIMRRDVERARAAREAGEPPAAVAAPQAAARPEDAEDWERRPLRGLRRAIARRMVRSRRSAAHFTYVDEVDMTELLERAERSGLGPLSPLAFISHATLRALAGYPLLNASIDDERGEIVLKANVHLGIATATEGGLLVPVIRDAARLSVPELAVAIDELASKGREGRLTPGELRGSTFTITSLGKLGGIMSTPIINHPEVAILSVNAIRDVLRLRDGGPHPRRVMNLSVSVDHRIADGLVAAQFIQDVKRILEGADFPDLSGGGDSR
jgi:pyruvate dehydrogenase E2 component (dihydrolipoamide acetyltransferase)